MNTRNKYLTSLSLSLALLLAPISGYSNHDNNSIDCSWITLNLDCTRHEDEKSKEAGQKVVAVLVGAALIKLAYDRIFGLEEEEMSLKLQEYSSGKGWRLNETESPIRVSLLPKKNDYANPYQENNTNMSYNFGKKERMLLSVQYDF
ncbi:MAG: hypothetical protein CMK36_01880 [Porticoccaceae bacterium]|nr:hypothetical protein [Porticoccaceae bacterium]